MELWNRVCKTDPNHTKKANVKGNNLTSIKPQYQIMMATEEFGSYGKSWGFKDIELSYDLSDKGLVVFKAEFYYPNGSFPAINTISIYRDNAQTKVDDEFAKKVETDSLTKCLSKLGFNADIFLGQFDDLRYIEQRSNEVAIKEIKNQEELADEARPLIENCKQVKELGLLWNTLAPNVQLLLRDDFAKKKKELEVK